MKTSMSLSDLAVHISSDQETSNINLDGWSKLWGRCFKDPGGIALSRLLRSLHTGGSTGALCFSLGLGWSYVIPRWGPWSSWSHPYQWFEPTWVPSPSHLLGLVCRSMTSPAVAMAWAVCTGSMCTCMDIVNIMWLFNFCCCPAVGKADCMRLPLQHEGYMYKQGTSYLCIWSSTNNTAAGGPAQFSQSRDTNTLEKA